MGQNRTRLVLSRRSGEAIDIGHGREVTVTLLEIVGQRVKVLVEAPPLVKILRREISGTPPRREGLTG